MTVQEVIKILALLTLASNIGLGLFIAAVFLAKFGLLKKEASRIKIFYAKKAQLLSFIVALIATSGSLFLSEAAHFEPCTLCWYQRIFMYPQVVILGMALWKKKKDMWLYSLSLSVLGAAIALYHYFLQLKPDAFMPCSAVGFSVSCSQNFFTYFGYITIPWMSLSAFLLITVGMLLLRGKK
jgi:disulfide bond formation protein DsbB